MNLRALLSPAFLSGLALMVSGSLLAQDDSASEPASPAPAAPAESTPAAPEAAEPSDKDLKPEKPAEKSPDMQKEEKPEEPAAPEPAPEASEEPVTEFGFQEIEKLTHVMEIIRQNYVDEGKVTYEDLINSALEGMLAHLDPHCQFMYPEVFEQMRRDTDGSYEGVGITVALRNDVLTVVAIREDGPAARSGILPGDQIVKINEFLTERIGLSEAMALMRGKPGQPLSLTLRRPTNRQVLEVEMVREVIQESTVEDVMMLSGKYSGGRKIGYARILQFSEPTARDLAEGLDQLEKQGMEAFVMDLRNNPGGLLNSAIDVCGEFVGPNTLVLTTEGREGIVNARIYKTPARKRTSRDYPVAILVNHASASGAEVVAGALQDLKRAVIVGETSFGKGSVQSVIPVPGGNAIRVTTAKYYTPSHRTIHENGVEPNIVATLTPKEEVKLMQWFRRETLDTEQKREAEQWTDRQLSRAADSLKGILVYQSVASTWKQEEVQEETPEAPDAEEAAPETTEDGPEKMKAIEPEKPEADGEGGETPSLKSEEEAPEGEGSDAEE